MDAGERFSQEEQLKLDLIQCRIMKTVETRIDLGRKRHILSDLECKKKYLEDFHKHFVLVLADKASNNILVVCKKLLLRCSTKET